MVKEHKPKEFKLLRKDYVPRYKSDKPINTEKLRKIKTTLKLNLAKKKKKLVKMLMTEYKTGVYDKNHHKKVWDYLKPLLKYELEIEALEKRTITN